MSIFRHALAAITATLALAGCAGSSFPPVDDPAQVEISLVRGRCLGPCPVYTVTLKGTGEVSWEGRLYVAFAGPLTYQIPPGQVAALVEQFRAADFFSLQDEYEAEVTDNPAQLVTIKVGGATKSVRDYVGQMAGMPAAVTALEMEIDRIADTQRWIAGSDQIMPALRAAHWDFRSRQAADALACSVGAAPPALIRDMIAAGTPVDGRCGKISSLEATVYDEPRYDVFRILLAAGAGGGLGQEARNTLLELGVRNCHPGFVMDVLSLKPDLTPLSVQHLEATSSTFCPAGDPGAHEIQRLLETAVEQQP